MASGKGRRVKARFRAPERQSVGAPPWMGDVQAAAASVDETSKLARNLFTYFLTASLYVAIAVGGTTDKALLLNERLALPVIGTEVPLTTFYVIAPLLLVAFHINLLVKLWQLALKAREREAALPEGDARTVFRELLFPYDFTMLVAGPRARRMTLGALYGIVAVLVFMGPVALFFSIGHRFAASGMFGGTAWFHTGLVAADIIALVFFRMGLMQRMEGRRLGGGVQVGALLGCLAVVVTATASRMPTDEAPGSFQDTLRTAGLLPHTDVSNECLIRGDVAPEFCRDLVQQRYRRLDAFKDLNALEARDAFITDQLPFLCQGPQRLDLSDRQFRKAYFVGTIMPCAVLQGSDLTGAYVASANLTSANLTNANLTGSGLLGADLAFTDLSGAMLTAATWAGANLPPGGLMVLSEACFAALTPRQEVDDEGRSLAQCGNEEDAVLVTAPKFEGLSEEQLASIRPAEGSAALTRPATLPQDFRERLASVSCYVTPLPDPLDAAPVDARPIGPDGRRMEDIPSCTDPSVTKRYEIWACLHRPFNRSRFRSGSRRRVRLLELNPGLFLTSDEACAAYRWDQPGEAAWLKEILAQSVDG